jgi:UDP-glucose:(heptosyl)LPS alpha-1,3-glucosyltransferase
VTSSAAEAGAPGPLRVAVVTPSLHRRGGTERTTSEMVARLARKHEVCLFAHDWEPEPGARVCWHRVAVLPGPGLARFLSFYWGASRAVRAAEQREGNFDVVYSPGPNCSEVDVVTAHFCQARQLELFREGNHRPTPASLRDRAKLLHRWSYAWVVARLERRFYQSPRLQRVLTQSELLARDLARYYGLPAEKCRAAYPGVDPAVFHPEVRSALREQARRELGLREDAFVFLFLGNNWLIKGLFHLLHAFRNVPAARLLIVGADGEPPEAWQELARRLGVLERAVFLPRRADVIAYYAAADALVAPSVYDTFALMPLEAMACGVPCIITRRMGIAEVTASGEALVVERPDEHDRLAAAMHSLMTDKLLYRQLAENGVRLAEQLTWEAQYRVTLEELTRVACASSRRVTTAPAGR